MSLRQIGGGEHARANGKEPLREICSDLNNDEMEVSGVWAIV